MKVENMSDAVKLLSDLGFGQFHYGQYCTTAVKSLGGTHYIVAIEGEAGNITFNGMDFIEWMRGMI